MTAPGSPPEPGPPDQPPPEQSGAGRWPPVAEAPSPPPAPRAPRGSGADRFLRFPGVARRAQPVRRTRRGPSPAGASLRSSLVPGWGQWAAGRRWRGLICLSLAVLLVLLPLGALLAAVSPLLPLLPLSIPEWAMRALAGAGEGIARLARPLEGLYSGADWVAIGQGVLTLNALLLLLRAWAAVDAAVCARRGGRAPRDPAPSTGPAGRLLPVVATTGAVLIVLAPHLVFGAGALAVRPLLAQVLQPAPPVAVAPPGPTPEATPSDPFAAVVTQLPPPDAARPLWDGKSALNVLLLGTDRRPRDNTQGLWGNSDTILIVSVDPQRQAATMVSVPRDLLIDNIPGVGREKVNAAYRRGGPDLAVRVVGDLLGIPIHRWASVDVSAFATMIDAVGGVVVDLEHPIRDDIYPNEDYSVRRILMPAGLQWLDGERALWFARSRHGSTDYDRANRQQRLLVSLKGRARDPSVLPRLPSLIVSLADAIQTDVSPREAVTLASLGVKTDFKSVRGLVLTPPEYGTEINRTDLYAVVPNRERIRRDVAALLAAEPSAPSAAPSPPAIRSLPDLPVEAP